MRVVGLHVPEAVDGYEAPDDADDAGHDQGELVGGDERRHLDPSGEEDVRRDGEARLQQREQ